MGFAGDYPSHASLTSRFVNGIRASPGISCPSHGASSTVIRKVDNNSAAGLYSVPLDSPVAARVDCSSGNMVYKEVGTVKPRFCWVHFWPQHKYWRRQCCTPGREGEVRRWLVAQRPALPDSVWLESSSLFRYSFPRRLHGMQYRVGRELTGCIKYAELSQTRRLCRCPMEIDGSPHRAWCTGSAGTQTSSSHMVPCDESRYNSRLTPWCAQPFDGTRPQSFRFRAMHSL